MRRSADSCVSVLAVTVWSVFAATASAEFQPGPFTPETFTPQAGKEVCDLDLRGVEIAEMNLDGASFVNCDLRGARFVGVTFNGATFDGCDLRGALFGEVVFQPAGASFRGVDLRDALFTQPQLRGCCDLTGALINGLSLDDPGRPYLTASQIRSTASFQRRDLSGCYLQGGEWESEPLDLNGFDLSQAKFVAFDLTQLDLGRARLQGASFIRCKLRQEQIIGAQRFFDSVAQWPDALSRTRLQETRSGNEAPTERVQYTGILFDRMDLRGWSFRDANLRGAGFIGCRLDDVNFTGARIPYAVLGCVSWDQLQSTASFRLRDLTGVEFRSLDLRDRSLSGTNLSFARFHDCHLSGLSLDDAVITGASFPAAIDPARMLSREQLESTWNFRHGALQGIRLPSDLLPLTSPSQ